MLLIGLLLGAAQIAPLYEMVSQNFRQGSASLEQVRGYAWSIRQASTMVIPDFLGNPARHDFYNLETRHWEPIVTQQPIDADGNTISIDHVAWFKGRGDWKNYVEGAGQWDDESDPVAFGWQHDHLGATAHQQQPRSSRGC